MLIRYLTEQSRAEAFALVINRLMILLKTQKTSLPLTGFINLDSFQISVREKGTININSGVNHSSSLF